MVFVLVLASCQAVVPPPPAPGRPLVIGIVGEPASLLGEDPFGRIVAGAVVEPLVRRTATEELEPRLVTSVPSFAAGDLALVEDREAAGGRLVARFRIRDGARWHEGAPVVADDVRFAFEEDRAASHGSDARALADRIARVDVIDERTARVEYRAGERWDLFALAPRALPRHILEHATPAARAQYASRPIHAGPYRVADRSTGRIALEPFADHVLGPPRIGPIIVRTYGDPRLLLGALLAGEVDLAPSPDFDADVGATLERSLGDRVRYTQAQAVAMLRFGPRLADPAIRLAASLTIDRERIARSVFGGRVRVPSGYLVAPLWAASETVGSPRLDRTEARSLLERAGSKRGNFGIAELRGDRLIVTLLVPEASTALAEAARGVAVDLALLGIAVDVSERPAAEIEQRVLRADFDLALGIEVVEDPLVATERYRGAVSTWWDVLADAARDAADRNDKRALYAELQRQWSEAIPALPLYQLLKVDVVPARMDGIHPASHALPITWNVASWRAVPAR
jgi:peptide/nickel transport system substrate-binding protein